MARVTVLATNNLSVKQISGSTSSLTPSTFNINSNSPTPAGTALASPGALLTVQVGVENTLGDPDRCTITVSDSFGNNSFFGQASVEWPENDTSIQFVQFGDFPLKADQVTPMDECNYVLSLVNVADPNTGTEASASVWTLAQADPPA